MKVLIVKDGTVPVGVLELLYEDGLLDNLEDRFDGELELFDVEGHHEALWVSWGDGDGFSVDGITFADGLKLLQGDFGDTTGKYEFECEPVTEVSPGHLVTTFQPGDREWYGHLFDMRRLG